MKFLLTLHPKLFCITIVKNQGNAAISLILELHKCYPIYQNKKNDYNNNNFAQKNEI